MLLLNDIDLSKFNFNDTVDMSIEKFLVNRTSSKRYFKVLLCCRGKSKSVTARKTIRICYFYLNFIKG